MLTLILLATLTQVYEVDYHFMLNQENWVIDQLPEHSGYTKYIPAKLAEQVNLWHDPCWRCRKQSNEAIVSDPSNLRWMFWTIRSLNPQVELHSEAIINHLIICTKCSGTGYCNGFIPDPKFENSCLRCFSGKLFHDPDHPDRQCLACGGTGIFENWPDAPWQLRRTYR